MIKNLTEILDDKVSQAEGPMSLPKIVQQGPYKKKWDKTKSYKHIKFSTAFTSIKFFKRQEKNVCISVWQKKPNIASIEN